MERTLVELAQHGDREAFSEIAHEISPRLFVVAYRILRDHHRAEDATQQSLVQMWRNLPQLIDLDKFDAWAYRIAVNACYGEARRERRASGSPVLLEVDAHSEDATRDVANRDAVERAFNRIPVEQRAVLVLQFYRELSHPQISELLGVPLGTVKSRASSGRSSMRAVFEADARAAERWSTT
jgi:RNA polymerase sigma-70 factor (ECF subfamily)